VPGGARAARQLVFLHLPRTGGTTVQHHLEAAVGRANVARVGLPHDFLGQLDVLRTSPAVVGHVFYPAVGIVPDAAVTTVLRDPVERSISVWEHPRWHPDHPDRRVLARRGIRTIDDFMEDPHFGTQVRNNQTRFLGVDYDLRGIVDAMERGEISHRDAVNRAAAAQLAAADEAMLERAKRRLERMLLVGVTEELSGFLAELDHRMGFAARGAMPRINATPGDLAAKRAGAYDAATRERLADINSLDAELYEFARGLWREVHRPAGRSRRAGSQPSFRLRNGRSTR
jgi:Sulfotransferase family